MAGPGGQEVGRASVRVLPDTTKFASSLQRFLERMEKQSRLQVNLVPDTDGFRAAVNAAIQSVEATARDLSVDMDTDPSRLALSARRAVSAAQLAAGDIDVKVRVHGDGSALARQVASIQGSAVRALSGLGGVAVSLGGLTAGAGAATVAVAGLAAPLAAAASAAAAAIGPVVALGAALSPSVIGSAALAVGTLKAAFSGFGEALKATDAASFTEAIKDLPPSAQAGATALYGLKNQLDDVKSAVQADFWANLTNVGDLGAILAPLGDAMRGLSVDMGRAAAGVVDFVSRGQGLAAMTSLLSNSGAAAGSLSYAVADIAKGLVLVGAAAAPMLADLAQRFQTVASGWAESMSTAFSDGSLAGFFDTAISRATALWGVVQQLGSIVGGVFSAMSAAGAPFLGTIGQIIDATAQWVQSAEGMSSLTSFFSSMTSAVGAVLPIFGQLAGIIGGTVAPAIADFVTALAPGVSLLVDGLGQGLQAIAPALAPLGAAFSSIAEAIAPVLPALGQVFGALGQALAPVLEALAPLLATVAEALTAVAPTAGVVAQVLGGVLGSALQAIAPLFEVWAAAVQMIQPYLQQVAELIGGALQQAISVLAPLMPQIASAFMQLLDALMPLLPAFMQIAEILLGALMPVFMQIMPIVVNLATTFINALVPVINALMPAIISLATAFANIVAALMPVISIVLQVVGVFLQLVAVIIGFVAQAVAAIVSFVAMVISGFVNLVATVIGLVSGWVSAVLGFFTNLVSSGIAKATELWARVSNAFSDGVNRAVTVVSGLPGRALSALGNVGSVLASSGRAMVQGFIDGILSMVGAVADAAQSVVSAARDFFPFSPAKRGPFSGRGWVLYSGRSLGAAFAAGIEDTSGLASGATSRLMDAASSNLEGYKADSRARSQEPGQGPTADYSVTIGTIVAADPEQPIKDAEEMQLKAKIRGGGA